MAPKRSFSEVGSCVEQRMEEKQPRHTMASIIRDVVMVKSVKHLFKALEPLLRQVVTEEVDRCLLRYSRSLTRASSLRIQNLEPSSLQLYFVNNLPSTIFTGSKITDVESKALRIAVEVGGEDPSLLPISSLLKIEIVVLDGEFAGGDREDWTAEEFNASIVKERSGKRPLLHGEMNATLRHCAATIGDLEFTDNSSWIRSRKFRLGARVISGSDRDKIPRIREAITEPFVVKDHRGELYKKHYPPMLNDEVWRLEKIGKEGVFHKKLSNYNIKTVQEFLKLYTIDPQKLRTILGVGMSDKMWQATIRHAKTCELGSKLYMFRGPNFLLFLNPICEVVRAMIEDQIYSVQDLPNIPEGYLENLRRQAFDNWGSLQDFEGNLRESLLLTEGNEGSDFILGKSLLQSSYEILSGQLECQDWDSNSDTQKNICTTFQGNFHYNY